MKKLLLFFSVPLIAFGLMIQSAALAAPADLIITNGKITTLDTNNPAAEAIAIAGGKIIQVGKDTDILKLKNNKTILLIFNLIISLSSS